MTKPKTPAALFAGALERRAGDQFGINENHGRLLLSALQKSVKDGGSIWLSITIPSDAAPRNVMKIKTKHVAQINKGQEIPREALRRIARGFGRGENIVVFKEISPSPLRRGFLIFISEKKP